MKIVLEWCVRECVCVCVFVCESVRESEHVIMCVCVRVGERERVDLKETPIKRIVET